MSGKVVFIDEPHSFLATSLDEAGFDVCMAPQANGDELRLLVADAVGVVVKSRLALDNGFFAAAPSLRFVARVGAGLESIDVHAAHHHNVAVLNSPEGNRDAVAEHCMGMLLALTNKLVTADGEMRRGIWRREANRGTELKGRTVGIVGYGHMGQAFAQRLRGFGVRVVAFDRYRSDYGDDHAQQVTLNDLLATADVVSVHIPWSADNDRLINAAYLARCERSPIIINSARGKVLVLADLADAIDSGVVSGAALDVFEYEDESFEQVDPRTWPDAYRRLCDSDRVILSPHVAGWTHASNRKHAETLFSKIMDLYG